jgi:hypothetical protein
MPFSLLFDEYWKDWAKGAKELATERTIKRNRG